MAIDELIVKRKNIIKVKYCITIKIYGLKTMVIWIIFWPVTP